MVRPWIATAGFLLVTACLGSHGEPKSASSASDDAETRRQDMDAGGMERAADTPSAVDAADSGRPGIKPVTPSGSGSTPDSGVPDMADAEMVSPSNGGSDSGTAASTVCELGARRVTPTVMLVIDGSQSMLEVYGSNASTPEGVPQASRWGALREVLVGPGGVVRALEDVVAFGLAIFGTAPACPFPTEIMKPGLGNAREIELAFPDKPPGLLTPTGAALDTVLDLLPNPESDPSTGSQTILLATDGDPNNCPDAPLAPFATTDYGPSIAAAIKARAKNVSLLVLGLGRDASAQHLQEMANLGAGLDQLAQPGAPVYQPDGAASLSDSILTLVTTTLGCDLALEHAVVPGRECQGDVRLDGMALACEGPDGWSLVDGRIRLLGAACDAFATDPQAEVSLSFPCDALEK